jgi:TolB-like protein
VGPAIDSIAVLPFTNATGSLEIDYLSDGLTETLTAKYRNQTPDPIEVGRDLNVRAIVTGRITQQTGRPQVQAELIGCTRSTGAKVPCTDAEVYGPRCTSHLAHPVHPVHPPNLAPCEPCAPLEPCAPW